jgi:hypothetical protein
MTQPIELASDIDAMFTQPHVIPFTRPGSWEPLGTRSGPRTGWHVWNAGHGAEVLLRSPFMNTPWHSAAASHECSRHGVRTVPQPDCREGIYLFTSREDAVPLAITRTPVMDLVTTFGFDLTYVVGQLSTPGPVNEHFNHDFAFAGAPEWIAQKVRIEALYLWPNFCSMPIQPLAREVLRWEHVQPVGQLVAQPHRFGDMSGALPLMRLPRRFHRRPDLRAKAIDGCVNGAQTIRQLCLAAGTRA